MSVEVEFTCDICKKKFKNRDDKGQPMMIGGMNGLSKKSVIGEDKTMKETVMEYKLDFCEECSKKMLDYYYKLGGK